MEVSLGVGGGVVAGGGGGCCGGGGGVGVVLVMLFVCRLYVRLYLSQRTVSNDV